MWLAVPSALALGILVALATDGHLANLQRLWLQNNQISNAGAQSLADALSAGKLPRLEELYLHAARSNWQQLDLSGNCIGDAGAEALARAVSGGGAAALKKLVYV